MKATIILLAGLISSALVTPEAKAKVYWDDTDTPMVSTRALQETNGRNGPAIWEVLVNSSNSYVRRAYEASAHSVHYLLLRNTDDGVWHPGGNPDSNHVTVKVMNGGSRTSTCHVYPFRDRRDTDYFYTTCRR